MKTKGLITLIADKLGIKNYKIFTVHANRSHYIISDVHGRRFYVIVTTRTLKYPKGMKIEYDGEMFGINRDDLYEIQRRGDIIMIVWALKMGGRIGIFVAPATSVINYTRPFGRFYETTCRRVRGSEEYVCHYPVMNTKLVGYITERSLGDWIEGLNNLNGF